MARNFNLGEAVLGTSVDLGGLSQGLGRGESEAKGWVNRVGGTLRGIGQAAIAGLATATVAVSGFAAALGNVAIQAAPVENIQAAFGGLTESIGKDTDQMLYELQRGSAGMIAQRDLMASFNEAAQLVSEDFAVQLPDAMESLRKVSAATGKDMDYLLDSLVTGVGRLSPMILDNLGIQVDLTKAYEDYAASLGVNADELSKQQQQTALTNQVMGLLADNTAAMPDILGTASQSLGAWTANWQDFKDEIGLAVLPALNDLLNIVQGGDFLTILQDLAVDLVDKIIPAIQSFIETAVAPLAQAIAAFATGDTERGVRILDDLLNRIFGKVGKEEGAAGRLERLITKIREFRDEIAPTVEKVRDWILENTKLSDWLIALGITVAVVVLPAIAGVAAAIGEAILVFAALVAAVAFVRKVIEEDFLGIRTAIETAIERWKAAWFEFIALWKVRIGELKLFIADVRYAIDRFTSAVYNIVNAVRNVIFWVDVMKDAWWNALAVIPPWMIPGSPTPFEKGLRGIGEAVRSLAMVELPKLEMGFEMAGATAGGGVQRTDNYNLTINTSAPYEPIVQDYNLMRAMGRGGL